MDLTPIFKASVKTVKLRNTITTQLLLDKEKASSSSSSSLSPTTNTGVPDKNRILRQRKTHTQNDFSKLAKDICHKITELRNLLIENRAAYMRFAQYLRNSAQMTDEQRDIIDRESEKFINYYTQYLGQIRSDWKHRHKDIKHQHKEHIENVIELLTNYLKCVNNLHLEQKKYRMQHELETYRLLKLASDKKLIPVRPGDVNHKDNNEINKRHKQRKTSEASSNSNGQEEDYDDDEKENLGAVYSNDSNSKIKSDNFKMKQKLLEKDYDDDDNDDIKSHRTKQMALDDDANSQKIYEQNELSPEDVQMFESENKQLFQELQGLSEEVEQIEKNVVDIARLQEVFTEKVSLQKHDIERIANAVVGSTENVKDANEQIKQAIQRNAGLRVWTLFFLLVMSFTLLFLDWYND